MKGKRDSNAVNIALIADIHIGPAGYHKGVMRKLTRLAEPLVRRFIREVNSVRPDFVVNLGDLIQDASKAADRRNFKKGLALLAKAKEPVHHVVGNHDNVNLKEPELHRLLGQRRLYYSFDFSGYHFVVLFSKVPRPHHMRIIFPKRQLAWLIRDLKNTTLPSVIFVHHALADQDLRGNFWFEGLPEDCLIENRREVRRALERSRKVLAVFNGHMHWNRAHIHRGIPYITIQSLTENFRNDGTPAGAFALAQLSGKRIRVKVSGKDRFSFTRAIKMHARV